MGKVKIYEDERKRLEFLELESNKINLRNNSGSKIGWYGARLKILMNFYNKTTNDVGMISKTKASNVTYWIANLSKPSDKQINLLSFFFEIPNQFFTEPKVVITLNEQLNITYEREETQDCEKTTDQS